MGSINRPPGEEQGPWGCILAVIIGVAVLAGAGWVSVNNQRDRQLRQEAQVERGAALGITKGATVRVRVDGRRVVVLGIDEDGDVVCMIPGEHTQGLFGGSKSQYYRGWFPMSALEPIEESPDG